MDHFDVAVIGGGPGGYVAALRAAQLGMRTALIEKGKVLGGTCLNVGCIPSKTLLHLTERYAWLGKQAQQEGIHFENLSFSLQEMMQRKAKIVSGLGGDVASLMRRYKVCCFEGEGKFLNATTLGVGSEKIQADKIVIATGSEPIALPFLPFDEKKVLSSTGALELQDVPKRLLVVGAGVIGLELGSVYQRLGAQVTFVEMMESSCFGMEAELMRKLETLLKREGMLFLFKTRVVKGEVGEFVHLTVHSDGKEQVLEADKVLVAIGRRPYTRGLNLEAAGVKVSAKGMVEVDRCFKTTADSIYAIGDVVDGPMLAHKASEEGVAVIDHIAGKECVLDYMSIPSVIYTAPEVASVGLTEEEARQGGFDPVVGRSYFKANARARCIGEEEGLVKIVGDAQTKRLLGMHILGTSASELIHEGVLAIKERWTLEKIAHACHAHPTLSETIKEAVYHCLEA